MYQAIERISAKGHLRFTERQLYFALAQSESDDAGCVVAMGGLAAIGLSILMPFMMPVAAVVTVVWLFLRLRRERKQVVSFPYARMRELISKWERAHGKIEGLISPRGAVKVGEAQRTPRAGSLDEPSDLLDYSFDFAIVTDRDETAELLVANNVHMNGVAVLSIESFPGDMRRGLVEAIAGNQFATILLLHDATDRGVTLASQLRELGWFPRQLVIDLGLTPRQAMMLRSPSTDRRPQARHIQRAEADGDITAEEAKWLRSRHGVELAVIPPARLLNVVRAAMGRVKRDREGAMLSSSGVAVAGAAAGGGLLGAAVADAAWSQDPEIRRRRAGASGGDDSDFIGDG